MNDIKIVGKAQKRNSPLRDKPNNMSLSDWIKLREKQRLEKVNAKLDGLVYERDPEYRDPS
jgi:hypothetical protein